jgi:Uma2 family endonuclease
MATTGKLMTAEELLRLPDDGMRHELIQGELRTMAPAGDEHGWVTSNLHIPLGTYVKAHRLGRVYAAETGFRLERDPDTVRAPDVAFVRQERLEAGALPGYRPGAPDFAVEVLSPSDRPGEVAEKVAAWLAHGTRMVLVVHPRSRTVRVHRPDAPVRVLAESDTIDGEDVVPGWQLPVREVFA